MPIIDKTTIISIMLNPSLTLRVNPLPRIEMLGDFIYRGNYGNRDKANQNSHDNHHNGLDHRRKALGFFRELLLIDLREIGKGFRKISSFLSYRDHFRKHIGKEMRIFRSEEHTSELQSQSNL